MEIIVAASMPRFGIGMDGYIPWSIKHDLKRFKKMTTGHIVIMGRKTFFSLPNRFRPLPDRTNVVISRSDYTDEAHTTFVHSLDEAIEWCEQNKEQGQRVFIIGGSEIIKEALQNPKVTIVHLTKIVQPGYLCDVFIPNLDDLDDWKQVGESSETVEWLNHFKYVIYNRK